METQDTISQATGNNPTIRTVSANRGVEWLVGPAQVQAVMGDPPPVVGGRFGRADVHPDVDLLRVAGDDLAAGAFGHRHRQRALAGCRRTQDGQQAEGAWLLRHGRTAVRSRRAACAT